MCLQLLFVLIFSTADEFGDDVHDFVVTAAAAGGALCNPLDILKFLFYIAKGFMCVQRIFNVCKCDLFAVANGVVLFHDHIPFLAYVLFFTL